MARARQPLLALCVAAIAVQGFRLAEHDAEDVFQEVFARAYQHLDRLREDEAIRPGSPSSSPPPLHRSSSRRGP